MGRLKDRIVLAFPDDFPDSKLAGQTVSLDPELEGKTIWWIGRTTSLQAGSKSMPVDITIRGAFISRAHCTIFYQFEQWYLMDGIYFPTVDEEMTTATDFKPGEYKPSHNGTWVDGSKLGYRDPIALTAGSRIVFGSYGYRAIVQNPDETIGESAWSDNKWPEVITIESVEEKTAPPINPVIETQLIQEAKAKICHEEEDKIESHWEMIYRLALDFGKWALDTPDNISDLLFRVLMLALIAGLVYRASVLIELYIKK